MTFNEWIDNNMDSLHDSTILGDLRLAFNAGFKAGWQKWHNLCKNPDDLPTDESFKITSDGDIAFYDWFLGKWYDLRRDELTYQPAAWCEIPKLEE